MLLRITEQKKMSDERAKIGWGLGTKRPQISNMISGAAL